MKYALAVIGVALIAVLAFAVQWARTTACLDLHGDAPWWYCLGR